MAEKVIKSEDIAQSDIFKDMRDSAAQTIPVMKELSTMLGSFLNQTKEQVKANPLGSAQDINSMTSAYNTATSAAQAKLKVDKEILEQEAKLSTVLNEKTGKMNDNLVELAKLRLANEEARKQAKEQAKEELGLNSEYQKQSKLLNDLRKEYKDLVLTNKDATKEARALHTQISELDKKLKDVDASVGQHQRNVGAYKEALAELPGVMGEVVKGLSIMGAAMLAVDAVKKGFDVLMTTSDDFADKWEQNMAGIDGALMVFKGDFAATMNEIIGFTDKANTSTGHWYSTVLAMGDVLMKSGLDFSKYGVNFVVAKAQMDAAANTMIEYTRAVQDLTDMEASMIVPRAEANRELKKARELTMDSTLTIEQKIAAVENSMRLEDEQARKEIEHQNKIIAQAKIVHDLKKSLMGFNPEDEIKYQKEIAKAIDLETESITRKTKVEKQLLKLRDDLQAQKDKDILDAAKKDKDAKDLQTKLDEELIKAEVNNWDDATQKKEVLMLIELEAAKKKNIEVYGDNEKTKILNLELEKKYLKDVEKLWADHYAKQLAEKKKADDDWSKEQDEFIRDVVNKWDKSDKETESKKANADKARVEREKAVFEQLEQISNTRYANEEKRLDRTIANSQRQQQTLALLAQQGVDNAKESLAAEQKIQADAEAKRAELQKKKERTEFAMTVLKMTTANLEANQGDPAKALTATFEQVGALVAVIQSLPSFFVGTEDTGEGGNLDSNGGFLAKLHRKEKVFNAEDSAIIGYDRSNKEVANIVSLYDAGKMPQVAYMPNYNTTHTDDLYKAVTNVEKAIKQIEIPIQSWAYDATEKAIIERVETRHKVITNHIKPKAGIWS